MNKDKAIQLLERLQDPEPYEPMLTKDAYDAIQMAIDALSADGDTISRKAAVDALVAETIYTKEELKEYYEANSHRNEWVNGIYEAVEAIEQLPPAQHEPHWIPVTEGLPKESGSYQVTTTHGKVAIYVFVADSISSHEYWKRCVTAWMPLPEPYKGVTT